MAPEFRRKRGHDGRLLEAAVTIGFRASHLAALLLATAIDKAAPKKARSP